MRDMGSVGKRVRTLLTGVLALMSVGALSLAAVPSAEAAGTYCSVRGGGCQLYAWANTSGYYFTTPGQLPSGMICWQDGQWTNLNYSTNRWFKMNSAAYGIFWAPASEVFSQISNPHC
jgi:hypothetical protein